MIHTIPPYGWWDSRGAWHPNPHIGMPVSEQKSANEQAGYACPEHAPYDAFSQPLHKSERRRIGRELPRCACGKTRAHDKEKCGTCLHNDEQRELTEAAMRAHEERMQRFVDQERRRMDELKADIMTANGIEDLKDVLLRMLARQEKP